MNNAKKSLFRDVPLRLYEPSWNSPLAKTIIELERLRVKSLGGPVPAYIFFELKEIFQLLESLGSARIEGNRTTLAEFIENIIEDTPKKKVDEKLLEILNIEQAMGFVENNISEKTTIKRSHILEIHKILTQGLTPPPDGEGSRYPGILRPVPARIINSGHIPPSSAKINDYIDELLNFVNQKIEPQDDLLVTALAHHRLAWIHPFDNGNGRLIRVFTYAMLIQRGFQVKNGNILNPTAIFCMDRNKYYDMLELADSGLEENILKWCLYVLDGLREEISKIDKLLDRSYLLEIILLPSLTYALERQFITRQEFEILRAVVTSEEMKIKSADIEKVIGQESPVQRSRIIKRLNDKEMLKPLKPGGRVYTIGFVNNFLLRAIIYTLEENGFIPASLNKNS